MESFVDPWKLRAINMTKQCAYRGCGKKRHRNTKYCEKHGREAAKYNVQESKVYFVMATGTGKVKIGFTERINARMSTLQSACPTPLLLLAEINAGPWMETAIHEHLKEHRVKGEWFWLSDEVVDLIAVAKDKGCKAVKKEILERRNASV